MGCICNNLKLPTMVSTDILMCVKIAMSNGETYTVKTDDLVAIQYVKDDKRKGHQLVSVSLVLTKHMVVYKCQCGN